MLRTLVFIHSFPAFFILIRLSLLRCIGIRPHFYLLLDGFHDINNAIANPLLRRAVAGALPQDSEADFDLEPNLSGENAT